METKGCIRINVFWVVLFHKEQFIQLEWLRVYQQKLLAKESAKRSPTEHIVMNVSSPAERFCQVKGMVKRQEERWD